jgi:CPA1 family monovalent cation:H+ antiporter
MAHLEEVQDLERASPGALEWLRREFADRMQRAEGLLHGTDPGDREKGAGAASATREEMRALRRELLAVESARLHELVQEGLISESVRRRVQRMLDLEEARAADE